MRYKLDLLNNTTIELNNKNELIIWITHDKQFKFGWYYLIRNNNLYIIYDTETTYEEHFIKNLGENNGTK